MHFQRLLKKREEIYKDMDIQSEALNFLIGDVQESIELDMNVVDNPLSQPANPYNGQPNQQTLNTHENQKNEKIQMMLGYKNAFNHKKQFVVHIVS